MKVVWKFEQTRRSPHKAASPSCLRDHMKYFHRINLIKKHKCLECGKMFAKRFRLPEHFRIHSGEKCYQCEICEKKLSKMYKPHKLGQCKKVIKEELNMQCRELNIVILFLKTQASSSFMLFHTRSALIWISWKTFLHP